MKLTLEEANKRLGNGEEVWFFINRYSILNDRLYQTVPPARLGELHWIYYPSLDREIPRTLSPLGKSGKPLKKTYVCAEYGYTSGSLYQEVEFFVEFYDTEKQCIDAYNMDLLEKMRRMSAADAKRSAQVKRSLLEVSKNIIRE